MNLLVLLLAAFPIACAVLAAFGFKGRASTVGVDLGTTFSVIGVCGEDKTVEIIPNALGRLTTPSVVHFAGDGRVLVGADAIPFLTSDPRDTIYNAKRFIGRRHSDVATAAASLPYGVAAGLPPVAPPLDPIADRLRDAASAAFWWTVRRAGQLVYKPMKQRVRMPKNRSFVDGVDYAWFDLSDKAQAFSQACQERTAAGGHKAGPDSPCGKHAHPSRVSPVRVGAEVVRALQASVDKHLGHSQARTAVIAVPAKFGLVEREATMAAFYAGGYTVARVMDEPTAAAVAYGLHRKGGVDHVIVYDLGGGTLDVSLLYAQRGSLQVIGTDGDEYLGGTDFDRRMMQVRDTDDRCRIWMIGAGYGC